MKTLFQHSVFFLIMILIPIDGFGQRTDFSGTWVLNEEKSELAEEFSMAPGTLFIDQEGNTLEIQRHSSWQGEYYTIDDTFTLDGTESENKGWMNSTKKSVVTWSSDSAVLTITTRMPIQDGEEMTVTEKITIEDANLVIESTASSSTGVMKEKYVFDNS